MKDELEKAIQSLKAHKDHVDGLIRSAEEALALHAHARSGLLVALPPRTYKTSKDRIKEAAKLLCSQRQYVKSYEIVAALEASGYVFSAQRKETAVSIVLCRDEEFVASNKYGWSLAESAHVPGRFK
jgi:hypothetical protein